MSDKIDPRDKIVSINVKKLSEPVEYPDLRYGKPLDTRNNLKTLLRLHNIIVKWNIMLRCREIEIPDVKHFVDEKENADLAHIYHLATTNDMPNKNLDRHLDSLAWENAYHPVRECIRKKPWDKVARMDEFIGTIKTKDDEFSYKIIRRWMFSAIAAAFSESGFAAQGVLVLQGKQNLGKTRWVKSLEPLGCHAVKEGILLDPSNKDSIITASQCWIAELGELDGTFRKADIARIKSYITNSVDVIRFPYNPRNSHLHRRTVFVATVNENNFLVDDTGNRRWWTIDVESINLDHGIDMQQMWAEVYHVWRAENAQTWLSEDEMTSLSIMNETHEHIDPLEEKFLQAFDFHKEWRNGEKIKLTTTDVLEKLGYIRPSKSDTTRMGKIIMRHTGSKPKKSNLRYHTLPAIKIAFEVPKSFDR